MLKKLRIWYWIISSFVKKYAIGLTIGLIAGVFIAIYSDKILSILPAHKTTNIGRIGSYTISQIPIDIQRQISRGLTKMDKNGEWVLDAAESITPSENGLSYTVILKPDLKWSTGEPITTKDIDLNIADVTITKPDEKTIVFTLKEPFTPFPTILSQPLLKKNKIGFLRKKTQIVGLNPYILQNAQTNNQHLKNITLSSDDETLNYHFYATEDDALTAFKLGKIDRIDNSTSPYLENWNHIQVEANPDSNRYLALFFNTTNKDLQDKTIRQMLAYAIPKPTDESRVLSPINERSWAYNPQVKPYTQNQETAKAMYEKLKIANPKIDLDFTLTTTPAYTDMAQEIINSWQQLGIKAQLRIVAFPDTNEYQTLLIGQQIPEDPDQYPLWHSTQSTNISHYQSPKIDKLLEDGRKELNRQKRLEVYQDFQRFLVEDAPAVFLKQLPTFTITRGASESPTNP